MCRVCEMIKESKGIVNDAELEAKFNSGELNGVIKDHPAFQLMMVMLEANVKEELDKNGFSIPSFPDDGPITGLIAEQLSRKFEVYQVSDMVFIIGDERGRKELVKTLSEANTEARKKLSDMELLTSAIKIGTSSGTLFH